jgi:hypothetical protein
VPSRIFSALKWENDFLCKNRMIMTTKDLRKEITRVIEQVPDDFLNDILSYLKEFELKSKKNIESANLIRKILREDHNLLERLAK